MEQVVLMFALQSAIESLPEAATTEEIVERATAFASYFKIGESFGDEPIRDKVATPKAFLNLLQQD